MTHGGLSKWVSFFHLTDKNLPNFQVMSWSITKNWKLKDSQIINGMKKRKVTPQDCVFLQRFLIWTQNNRWWRNCSHPQCQSSLWLFSSLFFFPWLLFPLTRSSSLKECFVSFPSPSQTFLPSQTGQAMKYAPWTESPRGRQSAKCKPEFKHNSV